MELSYRMFLTHRVLLQWLCLIADLRLHILSQDHYQRQYQAQLKLTRLEQRDALLRALSNYDAQTTLVIAIKSDTGLLNTITDPKIFYFAENYYPYIYRGIAPPNPRLELILIPIEYHQYWYNYYQDNIRKDYLYYLTF